MIYMKDYRSKHCHPKQGGENSEPVTGKLFATKQGTLYRPVFSMSRQHSPI